MELGGVRLLLPVMATCLCAAACTSWKAARPTVVCGTTVSGGGAGVILAEPAELVASVKSEHRPYQFFPGTLIRVSDSCREGATVTIDPPGLVTITPLALAKDGRPVVIDLAAQKSVNVTMTVHAGGSASQVRMTVIAFPAPSSVQSVTSPG